MTEPRGTALVVAALVLLGISSALLIWDGAVGDVILFGPDAGAILAVFAASLLAVALALGRQIPRLVAAAGMVGALATVAISAALVFRAEGMLQVVGYIGAVASLIAIATGGRAWQRG